MNRSRYSEGFHCLVKPIGDKKFRVEFLVRVKECIKNQNNGLEVTDEDAIWYALANAHTDEIKGFLSQTSAGGTYEDVGNLVRNLIEAEYGIALGTLLYGLIQVDKVNIGSRRKEAVSRIFRLQGVS